MNEVRIYQSLKHNNIVKFMGADLSTPKREVRIFMEYIPHTLDVSIIIFKLIFRFLTPLPEVLYFFYNNKDIRKRTMYNNLHYFTASQIAKCMYYSIDFTFVYYLRFLLFRYVAINIRSSSVTC